MVPRSASAPCRLPLKLQISRRCLCQLPSDLKVGQTRPAFWPSGERRKRSQETVESAPLQGCASSQSRTVSAKPLHTATSAGTGTVGDSAKLVECGKGPGRGRRFLPAIPAPPKHESGRGTMRVFLISDIHTDYDENLDWIRDLSPNAFLNDALIVAGDVSDSIPIFEETFRILRPKFAHVFFTPGNHDLWIRSNKAPTAQTTSTLLAKPDSKPSSELESKSSSGADSNPRTSNEPNPEPEGNSETASTAPTEPSRHDASVAVSDITQATKVVSGRPLEPVSGTGKGVDVSVPSENSLSKLAALFKICEDLGVDTRPKFLKVGGGLGSTREGGGGLESGREISAETGLEGSARGRGPVDCEIGQQTIPKCQQREIAGCGSIGDPGRGDTDAGTSASVNNMDSVASTLSQVGERERNPEAGTSERVANRAEPVDESARPSPTFRKEVQRNSAPGAGLNGAEARVAESLPSVERQLTSPGERSKTVEVGGGGNGTREFENRTRRSGNGIRAEENETRADKSGTRGGGTGTSGGEDKSGGGGSGTEGGGDGPGISVSEGESGQVSGIAEEEHGTAGVWVVPILSWHHISFDTEPDIPGYNIPSIEKVAKDHKVCKWPPGWDPRTDSVARAFDEMNHELHRGFDPASTPGCHVITFSHFLPRLELIPEKRFLFYPNLAKAVGSHALEARVRSIHAAAGGAPGCHLFGHTHFSWDMTLDGIRYIQAPLAYPRERKRRMNGGDDWLPLCVYDSGRGGVLSDENRCYWSDYYKTRAREPENFEFAPWVANLWKPIRKVTEPAGEV